MSVIDKHRLVDASKKYVRQLNYYMISIAPKTNTNTNTNTKTNTKTVIFSDSVDIRYYELEENEKHDKRIMFNHIQMKRKLRDIVYGIS